VNMRRRRTTPLISAWKPADGMRFSWSALLITAAVMATLGCKDDGQLPTYPVTGKVLFPDGKPLVDGNVLFVSRNHELRARGRVEADGSYDLSTYEAHDGAVEGPHQVLVLPFFDRPDGPPSVPIHPRLQQFSTSGLSFQVSPDRPNEFNITVEPP
jgi:hypothetical protein